jgi:hypothetical protein
MSEMFQHVKFPFPDERFPDELGAAIQKTVLDGQLPARYVAHTEDNSWLVGDDLSDPNVEGAAIAAHIRHVVDADPTLEPLATLPPRLSGSTQVAERPLGDPAVQLAC